MRAIDKIIVHCTATPEGRDVKVGDIRRWHVEDNGWNDIGYHWVIELDGSLQEGRKEYLNGAHAKGHNSDSVGVVYVGGCDKDMNPKDTRTEAQKEELLCILQDLKGRYPNAEIIGHCDVSSKACPSFDAKEEYKSL
jgi:N-acetylmuramoyl-L-alanine amidase|tara:strand:+ start:5838 stop:6248 length:411 start_codon:yes stop_codon:yes gene_type:complete